MRAPGGNELLDDIARSLIGDGQRRRGSKQRDPNRTAMSGRGQNTRVKENSDSDIEDGDAAS